MKQQSLKEINKRLSTIGKAVKINWGDAHSARSMKPEYAEKLFPVESWGRLIMKTKETVVLSSWIGMDMDNPRIPDKELADEAFKHIIVIPRKCIYRVRIL